MYLTGITGTPPKPEIAKTALGAEGFVPWEYHENTLSFISELQSRGVIVLALEQSERSIDYRKFIPRAEGEYCLVFGNEVGGVPQEVLDACDLTLEIPMYGKKKSLNVSTAGGILMFRFGEFRFPPD